MQTLKAFAERNVHPEQWEEVETTILFIYLFIFPPKWLAED